MSKSDGMIGLARKGETELECPFCSKGKVKVFHKEGYLQAKTSRISAGAKTTYHRVPDTYEVLENCPKLRSKEKRHPGLLQRELQKETLPRGTIKTLEEKGIAAGFGND